MKIEDTLIVPASVELIIHLIHDATLNDAEAEVLQAMVHSPEDGITKTEAFNSLDVTVPVNAMLEAFDHLLDGDLIERVGETIRFKPTMLGLLMLLDATLEGIAHAAPSR